MLIMCLRIVAGMCATLCNRLGYTAFSVRVHSPVPPSKANTSSHFLPPSSMCSFDRACPSPSHHPCNLPRSVSLVLPLPVSTDIRDSFSFVDLGRHERLELLQTPKTQNQPRSLSFPHSLPACLSPPPLAIPSPLTFRPRASERACVHSCPIPPSLSRHRHSRPQRRAWPRAPSRRSWYRGAA